MSTSGKIAISVGIASSALLAAWLLTGNRKEKTKEFVVKTATTFKGALKTDKVGAAEEEAYYI
ncbi:MAG TPA: hypothetical protein VIU13_17170 [Chryseolinea sp.]